MGYISLESIHTSLDLWVHCWLGDFPRGDSTRSFFSIHMMFTNTTPGRSSKTFGVFLSSLVLLCLCLTSASAQTITTGDITGTVTDQSGAVVPNATLSLKN